VKWSARAAPHLRSITLIGLLIGSIGAVLAEAGILGYEAAIYAAAENLLAVALAAGVSLAVLAHGDSRGLPAAPARRAAISGFTGVLTGAALVLLLAFYENRFVAYDLTLGALLGLGVAGVTFVIVSGNNETEGEALTAAHQPFSTYAALTTCLILAGLLRATAPGSLLAAFVFAPVVFFIVPGLALSLALLPPASRALDHLIYAPPLSIGVQLLGIAWAVALGIALTPLLLYALAGVVILIGFAVALYRSRHVTK
jgi:hypothetical protein